MFNWLTVIQKLIIIMMYNKYPKQQNNRKHNHFFHLGQTVENLCKMQSMPHLS